MKIAVLVLFAAMVSLVGCKGDGPNAAEPSSPTAEKTTEAAKASPSKVDGAKARELVKNGAILLDVRTQGEYDGGHIEGSKLIPVQELSGRLAEVGSKDKPVVVYCASGMRSNRAAHALAEAGWSEVYDLGPMSAW